jgi:hypothetical protein
MQRIKAQYVQQLFIRKCFLALFLVIGVLFLGGEAASAKTDQASFALASSQSISLVPGWNLVSFNLHPASTAITDVLGSLDSNYDLV